LIAGAPAAPDDIKNIFYPDACSENLLFQMIDDNLRAYVAELKRQLWTYGSAWRRG
jgi:hypothetical protein